MLWQELRDAGFKETPISSQQRRTKINNQRLTPRAQIERQLIEALIQNPALIPMSNLGSIMKVSRNPALLDRTVAVGSLYRR